MMKRVLLMVALLGATLAWANEPHCDDPKWTAMANQCCPVVTPCDDIATACALACSQSCVVTNTCPGCPDVVPACAKYVRHYTRKGALKSERCIRWATVSVQPAP